MAAAHCSTARQQPTLSHSMRLIGHGHWRHGQRAEGTRSNHVSFQVLRLLVYDQRAEPIERFQLLLVQISERQLLVHYPQWSCRIAAVNQALPVRAGNFRHNPLPDTGADLAVSWIKLAIVGNVHDLVCPVVHKQEPCRAVAVAEAVNITHGPATDRALAGHTDIAADGPKTLTFCHSIANNIGKITGVISLCDYSMVLARDTA
jgi:hypothetical protein